MILIGCCRQIWENKPENCLFSATVDLSHF